MLIICCKYEINENRNVEMRLSMKIFGKYIKPYLVYFVIGPLLMLTEVVCEVLLPSLMARIINFGVGNGDVPYILRIGLLMLGIAAVMLAGGVGGNFFAAKASINFASALRLDVFKKVQDFSFSNIDKFSTGSLITRMTNDITQMQNVLRMVLVMMLRAPGMLIGGLVMALSLNKSLTVVLAVVIPILIIIIISLLRIAFPRFTLMQKKIDNLNATIQENLTNARVVKSFVRGEFENEKFGNSNRDLKENSLRALKMVIFAMPIMMLAMNLTTLAVVWFGGKQIILGEMMVGDLTAFTTYIIQILMSLMMLSMIILQSSRAIASGKRISEVLVTEVDIKDNEVTYYNDASNRKVGKGKIEFKNVSFRYYKDNENNVLNHISFIAEPGQIVGIIGSTGSGKSSLVQLIPRLYDVDEGEVLVDDVNVKDYSIKNLRDGVGMVLQKNVLFSGTIKENLKWGNEEATDEEIYTFAEASQAHGFISSFTEGYDTELGQGGVNVSGGQKQRICIARALLKKPKILILDDSTSAVDTATEAKIRESFSSSLKDTTKLIIAQRISSVIDADKIIVMDDGNIVGIGKHDELLKSCETYQEIYYSQQEKEA